MTTEETVRELRNAAKRAMNRLDDNDKTDSPRDEEAALDQLTIAEKRLQEAKMELTGQDVLPSVIVNTVAQADEETLEKVDEGSPPSISSSSKHPSPYLEEGVSVVPDLEESEVSEDGDDSDKDDGWGLIGTASSTSDESERGYYEPGDDTRTYEVLKKLQLHGPITSSEAVAVTDLNENQITSELRRLFEYKLMDRSKNISYGDAYKYWITEGGESLLQDRGDWEMRDEVQLRHRNLRDRFGRTG